MAKTQKPPSHLMLPKESLEAWLREHVPHLTLPIKVEQFASGQSNPTYLLTSKKTSQRCVLRRRPPSVEKSSAHAVDREFLILQCLSKCSFPVPKPYELCVDADVIGSMFYVMEALEGEIFWDPSLPSLSSKEREHFYRQVITTLARLHKIEIKTAGLEHYGKPHGYIRRQVERWGRIIQHDQHPLESMLFLKEWLLNNLPPEDSCAIVHGDYRINNLMFNPETFNLHAVLDWELSTLGHAMADVTYHSMLWHVPPNTMTLGNKSAPTLVGVDHHFTGIPNLKTYLSWYAEETGNHVEEHLPFWLAFNFFRYAGIVNGIVQRAHKGTASQKDALKTNKPVKILANVAQEFATGKRPIL